MNPYILFLFAWVLYMAIKKKKKKKKLKKVNE